MADEDKSQTEGLDRANMTRYIVPAAGVAALVLLVGLVIYMSGADARKMSDGSNGSVADPDLKELTDGVKYRDIKEGIGEPCPAGAKVTMHYTGWLADYTVFDSSLEGKGGKATPKPATFALNELIPGWKEGVPGMKRGGIRKLVIAPHKGYGRMQRDKIPADSTLVFEVELVDFIPPPRERRYPPPSDLAKLTDGSSPGTEDPNLKPIGTTGLMYRDIKVGDGVECPQGAHVVMDYTGWLTNGTVFDSSWKEGREPLDMSLHELIKGWQHGVPGMKVGGIRKLVIPPSLAYGERGSPPAVPPNATLTFEIELLGIR